jgi:hypothetical protein
MGFSRKVDDSLDIIPGKYRLNLFWICDVSFDENESGFLIYREALYVLRVPAIGQGIIPDDTIFRVDVKVVIYKI